MIIIIRCFVIDKVIISGTSMYPTLENKDVCLMKKNGLSDVKRYDIVIAKVNGKQVVKRVVGMSGDTIQIKENTVYINGEKIADEYDFVTTYSGIAESIVIKEGEYFLLGDNRDNSFDSRDFGNVKFEHIIGIVSVRIFPFPIENLQRNERCL